MRDLELRGAGNLLGTDQSGSISAVGFELYCQLLKEEITRLNNINNEAEQAIDTQMRIKIHGYFPSDYVADTSLQIMLYQKCTSAKTIEELGDFEAEITDRFGAYPEPVGELLLFMSIKILAGILSIKDLALEANNTLTLTLGGESEKQAKSCSQFMAIEEAKFTLDYGEQIKLKCKIPIGEPMQQARIIMTILTTAKSMQ
jgi:transcription-repair coupling factor (superfamily II helicase)